MFLKYRAYAHTIPGAEIRLVRKRRSRGFFETWTISALLCLTLLASIPSIAHAVTNRWIGNAAAVAQVDTITPGGVIVAGDVFHMKINTKDVTYTATGTTVASVTAGMVAVLNSVTAVVPAEYQEITWVDNTTSVGATSKVQGRPFTITSSATGSGTSTFVTAVATANGSPNDVANTANWSAAAIPINNDVVVLENTAVSMLYGLDQHTVTGITFKVMPTFSGSIGLPFTSANGYPEYRGTYLQYGIGTLNYAGTGPKAKIDLGTTATTTITVNNTGTSNETGTPALLVRGGLGNTYIVNKGDVGGGIFSGDAGVIAAVTVNYISNPSTDAQVHFGTYTTSLTTATCNAGTSQFELTLTTLNLRSSTATVTGNGATTINNAAGTLFLVGNNSITTYNGGKGSTLDFRKDGSAISVTNATVTAGAAIYDNDTPRVSWSNPIALDQCGIEDCTLRLGKGRTLQPN